MRAGDCFVAWHNTTEFLASATDDVAAVALCFHLPSALVNTSSSSSSQKWRGDSLTAEERSCLKRLAYLQESEEPAGAVPRQLLTDAEAHAIMHSCSNRATALFASGHREGHQEGEVHSHSRATSSLLAPALAPLKRPISSLILTAVQRALPSWLPSLLPHRHGPDIVFAPSPAESWGTFRFPRQNNRLAFAFDPRELGIQVSFGIEVFEPGHITPLHRHSQAHELFFILSGQAEAWCDGQHLHASPGDCLVFPPGCMHGLDNNSDSRVYCLQLMAPNQAFVEYVKTGTWVGRLENEDLCKLAATHC